MTTIPRLHQIYAAAIPELSIPQAAEAPPEPRLVVLNEELARELGYDPAWLRGPEGLALLTGGLDAEGRPGAREVSHPFTTAQVYAGHQFGRPNPLLGDGRAVLLGDLVDARGRRRDLHLKGSGPTPFARAGDGRAPLGPMLREHLVGEAMHALGIPTTRALAVTATGAGVLRRGPVPEPGAMLTRVAASHVRVGTFEYAAWHGGPDLLRSLTRWAIDRHWPAAREEADEPLALLRCVTRAQAELVARWMSVGFVHGVMNTDNMAISGETIDYGPCAFLDVFSPSACFSSIDAQGRYAYGRQGAIALWNLARFAEALLPVIDEDPETAVAAATEVLGGFEPAYVRTWTQSMAARLGVPLADGGSDEDLAPVRSLAEDALHLLERHRVDHTGFFRALTEDRASELLPGEARAAFAAWDERRAALAGHGERAARARARMAAANPVYIPRNHHLEAALRAAELGDLAPYERLLEAVTSPFTRREGLEELEGPGAEPDAPFVTFCGT